MQFKIINNQLLCEDGSVVVERDECDLDVGETLEQGLLKELEHHKFWLEEYKDPSKEYENDPKEFKRMQKEFLPIVLKAIDFLNVKKI